MKPYAIEAESLEVGYFHNKKLSTLFPTCSFQIKEGELVAIVGSNGMGKSTLLKSLSNQIPFKGCLKMFSRKLSDYSHRTLAKTICSIDTHFQVQAYSRVEDIIAKGRSVHTNWIGILEYSDNQIIQQSAERVGVAHLLHRFYNTLSDGEKQRTLLAMALAQQSKIVLLDEPTAFIDYPNKYFLIALLRDIAHQEQKTILFSSHDLDVVLKYADKIIFIAPQQLYWLTKAEFLQEKLLQQLFDQHQLPYDFKSALIQQLIKQS